MDEKRGAFVGREEGRLNSVSSTRESGCGAGGGEMECGDLELGSVGVGRSGLGTVRSSSNGLCDLDASGMKS